MYSKNNPVPLTFTLRQFESVLEEMKTREIARFAKKMSEKEQALAEQVGSGMIQKIMRLSALQLQAAYERGEGEKLCRVLQQLFALEKKAC